MQFKSVQNACHFTVHYCTVYTVSKRYLHLKKYLHRNCGEKEKKSCLFNVLSSRINDVKKRTVRVRPQVRVEKSQLGSHLASGMRRL